MRRVASPFLLAAAAFLAQIPHASAQTKIGVVDFQGALLQTEDGRRAQHTFKNLFDKRQQEIEAKQAELAHALEDIDKQARVLSREALARRREDWQRRGLELQAKYLAFQKELQEKQASLMKPIQEKLLDVVKRVAHKNGYDIIIDKTATTFAADGFDLTDQVVSLYNRGGDAGGSEPKDEKKDEKKDGK